MKGKLPLTEMMILESEESQWRMLINGLINSLKTTAIIEIQKEIKKVRINLVITSIIPPEHAIKVNTCSVDTDMGKDLVTGISRSREFLVNYLDKTSWLFVGYIDSDIKVPILITYYQSINVTIYTQKLKDEESNLFFNPRLN